MLDEVYGKGLQGAGDGVQETPLGSPLVEVKDVVVVVNRSDIKSSGVLPSFLQSGGGGGGGKKGGVSSSIQSQDYPPGISFSRNLLIRGFTYPTFIENILSRLEI